LSSLAVVLVLAAAFAHASWNLIAKRAGGGAPFVLLYSLVGAAACLPLAVGELLVLGGRITPGVALFSAGSGVLHAVYFSLVQLSYRYGDLSVVYPLARGTAPVLATGAAIAFFGERPSALALIGGALIAASVLTLPLTQRRRAAGSTGPQRTAIRLALVNGAVIASFTLWDKHAVSALDAPPLAYFTGSLIVQSVLTAAVARVGSEQLRATWRRFRTEAVGVGVLSPLAYVLVLVALIHNPVAYVAPAREVSILLGVALGARVLGEDAGSQRLAAAAVIVAGIALLAAG
jgi:drug/metabolite transporter (DMT)-like permease